MFSHLETKKLADVSTTKIITELSRIGKAQESDHDYHKSNDGFSSVERTPSRNKVVHKAVYTGTAHKKMELLDIDSPFSLAGMGMKKQRSHQIPPQSFGLDKNRSRSNIMDQGSDIPESLRVLKFGSTVSIGGQMNTEEAHSVQVPNALRHQPQLRPSNTEQIEIPHAD